MYKSQGGGPGSYTRREKEIFLARSVFLRCDFLLAQEIVPLLPCIFDEHNQRCYQCYGKKYFHAPRIARSRETVLYSEFANTKQKCKRLNPNTLKRLDKKFEFSPETPSDLILLEY
jgi:hypothetical protein